jgi:hypothetical protein
MESLKRDLGLRALPHFASYHYADPSCRTIVGDFDDHKSPVGRVEWNITGYICFYLFTWFSKPDFYSIAGQSSRPLATMVGCDSGRPPWGMCGVQLVILASSKQKSNRLMLRWMIMLSPSELFQWNIFSFVQNDCEQMPILWLYSDLNRFTTVHLV